MLDTPNYDKQNLPSLANVPLLPLYIPIKNQTKNDVKKSYKSACFKRTYGLSGNEYRAATLSKLYITVIGIIV